jgi:hypothetical protein
MNYSAKAYFTIIRLRVLYLTFQLSFVTHVKSGQEQIIKIY